MFFDGVYKMLITSINATPPELPPELEEES
jgi:hypothetical protein